MVLEYPDHHTDFALLKEIGIERVDPVHLTGNMLLQTPHLIEMGPTKL